MVNPTFPFVGRVSEISEIKWSHMDRKIVLLTGPRGVGKSELSKKYAQYFKLDNVSSTLWINSESHLSVKDTFGDLAITVGVNTQNKEGTTIIEDVVDHFSNRKTLFVFDNASSSNLIVGYLLDQIGKYKFINVIITSRDEDWDQNKYKIININPFTLEEASMYIKQAILKSIKLTIDDESCKRLAELLHYIPLALHDAVNEIFKQNSLNPSQIYTINDFIESFTEEPDETITEVRERTQEVLEDAGSTKIQDEVKKIEDQLTVEAKRFGQRVEAEEKRFKKGLKIWFA